MRTVYLLFPPVTRVYVRFGLADAAYAETGGLALGPLSVRYITEQLDDGAPFVLAAVREELVLIADHRVYPEEAVATAALRVQTWGNAHRLSSRAVLDTLGPVGPVVITGSPTQWPLPAPAAQ